MWVKALFKPEPKVNPLFALDMPTYNKITDVLSFYPTVIHATYLHSSSDLYLEVNPEIQLSFDGTVTTSMPTGLPLHTFADTGCHKTLLSKKFYDQHKKHFQNFYEVPFFGKTFYNCRKWTTDCCSQNDIIAFADSRSLF